MAISMISRHGNRQKALPASQKPVNVDDAERWGSGISGAALALYGVRRRSVGGIALTALGVALLYRSLTGRSPLYRALNLRLVRTTGGGQRIEVVKTLTINRPPEELYRFWRNFENLPTIMQHLESVQTIDKLRSHWVAKAPAGATVDVLPPFAGG